MVGPRDGESCPAWCFVLCSFLPWYRAALGQSAQMPVHIPLTVSKAWNLLTDFPRGHREFPAQHILGKQSNKTKEKKDKSKVVGLGQ